MATEVDIEIARGEDITLNFTCWADPPTNTVAQDITGWNLTFTAALRENSEEKLFTKTCTILVAGSGTFKAVILAADTEGLTPGTRFWDVWRTDTGFKRLLGSGSFIIKGVARLPPAPAV